MFKIVVSARLYANFTKFHSLNINFVSDFKVAFKTFN